MSALSLRTGLRPWIVAAAMCLTAGATLLATPTRHVAVIGSGVNLEQSVPASFKDWEIDRSLVPVDPSPELKKVIEETYSQTLSRTYRNAAGYRIMLSMAIGDQVSGIDIHRPEICYPAQGFELRRDTQTIAWKIDDRNIPVRQLVAGAGGRNEPISYWMVVGDQIAAVGLQHRLATLKYGLTGRIPDGILVRVSSIDTDVPGAYVQQERFVREMIDSLSPQFRQRMLGAL